MTAKAALAGIVKKFKKSTDVAERLKIARHFNKIRAKLHKKDNYVYPNYPTDFEIFRDIKGYEGIYQIGNWGTVMQEESFFIKTVSGGKHKMAVYKERRIKKYGYHMFGYPKVSLYKTNKYTDQSVHRLVAQHFIPNKSKGTQVLHKDDDPKNAKWDNLFWGTQKDNIRDCVAKGRWHIGEKNCNAKLTAADIPTIKWLAWMGLPSRAVAKLFGVAKAPIQSINRGKAWNHVKTAKYDTDSSTRHRFIKGGHY